MKKSVVLFLFVFILYDASAQFCGSTDTLGCLTSIVPDSVGLYPKPDSFPPVFNNFIASATIPFRNFDTLLFGTEVLPVYSLTWDTIENLPPGLCWSTNKANNTYATGEAGCIHIRGTACGPTGQYKLSTLVTVDIGVPVETDGDPGGLGYFIRLQNFGDSIIPVDTTQTDSTPFIPYGGLCQNLTPLIVSLGSDQTVCQGSIVTFTPSVSGGQPPYFYQWQSTGSSIICSSCSSPSVTVTQNSMYILKVTDESGLYGYDTVTYFVTGVPYNFQITAPEPSAFCGGGSVAISANANDSVSFQWYNGPNILTGDTSNALVVTNATGFYYLVYNEPNCQATSNIINLVFYDTTSISVTSLSSDTFCVGGSATLLAYASGNGLTYSWLANDSNLNYGNTTLVTSNPGYYQAIVTNAVGCNDTSSGVLVVASPNLPPALTYTQFASDTICNNAPQITLSGGQPAGGYYSGNGVTDTTFNPFAANTGLNFIYYNYTDSTGCGNSVFDTIDVLLCTGIQNLATDENINLFPNPATDYITIQSELFLQGRAYVSVYDITGKQLYLSYQQLANNEISVDINTLDSGCYWLQLTLNGKRAGRRFVKAD